MISALMAAPGNFLIGKKRDGTAVELPAATMHWPTGVVPSLSASAHKLGAIKAGWVRHPDDKLVVLEAQLDGEAVTEAFLGLVEKLPVADNLEVRVMDHHDGGGATEVWLTPRIDVKKAIRGHILADAAYTGTYTLNAKLRPSGVRA